LATIAAREVKRPVKLILERPQMFGPVGGRPQTEQRVALGAKRDGTLVALRHDVISHTSQFEDYAEPATQPTRALYKVANVATTTYPAHRMPAKASVALSTDGMYVVRSATHDLGTGTYTILTQVAADALGVAPDKVKFELGDTTFPKAPVSGGSMTAASVGPA